MKSFRVTLDLLKKGATLNFFIAKDDVLAFLEMNGLATTLCCLNEVVLVCAVNPSGRRDTAKMAIPIPLTIRIQMSRGLRGFNGLKSASSA